MPSSPPTYRSESPSSILTNKNIPDGLTSEATPLLPPAGKRRPRASLAIVVILVGISFTILPIIFLLLWAPHLGSGVVVRVERPEWEQRLEAHLDEHPTWERQFQERQRQDRVRQDDWERELAARRLDEQLRMDRSERQFEKKQRQEKAKQDEWIEGQEQQRLREHLREKQLQREDEERQRLGLYWANLEANIQCTAYNTREYKARLLDTVPYEYNRLKPCEEMPIVIHDRSIRTTRCEIDQDGSGEVYGHWRVDFDEPACTPYWDQFKDKGCITEGSHKRRIEAHLANIHSGEDGEKLCASTPHDFYGRHFDHPDSCAELGNRGIFGIWDVDDASC